MIAFTPRRLQRLEDILADRHRRLVAYQDQAYARRFDALLARVQEKDLASATQGRLARAVARSYYKLLAHKDEYEVARLFSLPEFSQQIDAQFEGDFKLHFHLGAWPFGRRDPATGQVTKREFGPWMLGAMRMLRHLRPLRGTWADPLRNSPERVLASRLLAAYEDDVEAILACPTLDVDTAVELASLPERIRGYGHIRERHAAEAEPLRAALRAKLGEGVKLAA